MRFDIVFDHADGAMYVVYEHRWNVTHDAPSACVWMIPGTWAE